MAERALSRKVLYKKDKSEAIAGFIFAAIPVVGFLLFGMVPLVFSLVISFSDVPNFDMRQMTGFNNQSILKLLGPIKSIESYNEKNVCPGVGFLHFLHGAYGGSGGGIRLLCG